MEFKQVILIRKDLGMGAGKVAAQAAHASVAALEKTQGQHPDWVEAWKESGMQKVVLKVQSKK